MFFVVWPGAGIGKRWPPHPTPTDDFSIGARAPLYQRRAPRAERIDEEAPASAKCLRSALATLLMEQWAWGERFQPHRSNKWPKQPLQMVASAQSCSSWPAWVAVAVAQAIAIGICKGV